MALPFPGTPDSISEARRFYGTLLGLAELEVPPLLGSEVLWFAAGEGEVHLFGEPSGVAVNVQSRRHPCLEVDDLNSYRGRVEAAGAETITAEPVIPGRPRFFVRDPFGNAIEFVEIERSTQAGS